MSIAAIRFEGWLEGELRATLGADALGAAAPVPARYEQAAGRRRSVLPITLTGRAAGAAAAAAMLAGGGVAAAATGSASPGVWAGETAAAVALQVHRALTEVEALGASTLHSGSGGPRGGTQSGSPKRGGRESGARTTPAVGQGSNSAAGPGSQADHPHPAPPVHPDHPAVPAQGSRGATPGAAGKPRHPSPGGGARGKTPPGQRGA